LKRLASGDLFEWKRPGKISPGPSGYGSEISRTFRLEHRDMV
jgi:hypothetical protein